ncbi:hypothetical protein CPLU01_11984 [Colletotrichum plurivorum]|uniref:BHLH domain-containing protein n=1 Tax=Colletotrichum plurivorum TaxID=2175906 RepID=A0A8H6K124_9PEZI|nr:hypothetical protein CPLU01_11984 [Colletotrichum plurivorum]
MNTTAQDTASPAPTATAPSETNPARKPTKKRVRNFTADDRAAHRIFEKGRREAFKERLTELAAQLPALADNDPQRLSKHVVVDESIARHKLLEHRCLDALRGIRSLMQERDELLAELNGWRKNTGASARHPRRVVNMDGLLETEKDTQRRASAARLGQHIRRRSSDGASAPSDELLSRPGVGVATSTPSDESSSHVPRVLPTEPSRDARAVSEVDGLLRDVDPSWPRVVQSSSADAFDSEVTVDGLTLPPDRVPPMQSHVLPGSVSAPVADTGDYQLLGGMGSHQQLSYQDLNSMDFCTSDATSFDTSRMPLTPSYMSSANLHQGLPFEQHQQQWVSWPG